jgi:ubiquinone/menaquinone biosynthesis C-methylase UbiE
MSQSIHETTYEKVKASFGPNAQQYSASAGHADQDVLQQLVAKVGPKPTDKVLDIGTGAGHTAIAFAPAVASVVALDLTPQMLEEVKRNAAAKGVTNLTTQQGPAESLPFEDGSFEVVVCRLTTHHFANLPQAVREMGRVLKPGGKLVIVDTTVPEDDQLDRQINEIELLRDPSHVRNYRPSEWRALLEKEARVKVSEIELSYYDEGSKMDFERWTTRIGTSPENKATLRQIFREADPRLIEVLKIEVAGDKIGFALPLVNLIAVKEN